MTKFLRLFAIILPVVVLIAMMIPATISATDNQRWFLDEDSHPVDGRVMEREIAVQTGSVTITAGGSQLWLANVAAGHDITFPGGTWTVQLRVSPDNPPTDPIDVDDLHASVGYYDVNTGFHAFDIDDGYEVILRDNWVEVEYQTESQTITEGNYLALLVTNNDDEAHIIYTDVDYDECGCGKSWLLPPPSDPSYPAPELAAAILLGVGLLGLGGYLAVRKYKAKTSSYA